MEAARENKLVQSDHLQISHHRLAASEPEVTPELTWILLPMDREHTIYTDFFTGDNYRPSAIGSPLGLSPESPS